MVWQNEHTTFEYLTEWVARIHHQVHDQYSKKGRLMGRESFSIAGLTGKLKLNQVMSDINFYKLDQLKLKQARLYKEKLWAGCGVPPLPDELANFHTFGDWLKHRSKRTDTKEA